MRHYADVKATDAEVVAKFYELLNQKAVCDYFGYKSNSQIQTILKRNGVDTKKVREEVRLKRYKEYREQGMTYGQIAHVEGISKERVKDYCNDNGLGYNNEEWIEARKATAFQPSVNWQERVDTYYRAINKAEVIEVVRGKGGESTITVKCCTCGAVKTLSSITLRHPKTHGVCEVCQRSETEKRKKNEILDRRETKEQERRHKRKIVQLALPMCTKCGMLVPKGHKVCEECKKQTNKEIWRKADIKRRSRLDNCIKDKDITLKKLYERDNGVCYLCGRVCEWTDCEWRDGVFIVGRNYPTIEHLKPLSKGGTHTWSNIKLACLSCNSKKYNREAV